MTRFSRLCSAAIIAGISLLNCSAFALGPTHSGFDPAGDLLFEGINRIGPILGAASGQSVTYTMQTGNLNAQQSTGGGSHGTFNNSATEIGLFAHDAGLSGQADFETFSTTGTTSGTARPLQVGDKFQITMYSGSNPFGFAGIFFDDNTTYSAYSNYNSNLRTSVTLGSSGNWMITNSGTSIDTGIAAANSLTIAITVTSSNTFNMAVTNNTTSSTTTYFDLGMQNSPGTAAKIQSFALALQNDQNTGASSNFYVKDGSLTDTGVVTLGASNLTLTISGVISNGLAANSASTVTTNAVTKSGTGTITLTGNNTYTDGTNINAGTLSLGVAQSGTGGPLGGSGTVASVGTISFGGGTLQFSASNTTDYSSRFSNAANQAYSLDNGGQTITLATSLTSSGGSLTLLGAGGFNLNAANTYSGATNIQNGTAKLGIANALPIGTTLTLGSTGNSAVLDLNATNQQLAGLLTSGTAGSQSVNNTSGTTAILDLNIASGTDTYGGTLGSTTSNRVFSLVKDGAGTLILSNNNGSNYNQGTTFNNGVVSGSVFGILGSTSGPLTFNGGTLQLTTATSTSRSPSAGAITLNSGGGTIDISNAAGTATVSTAIGGAGALTKAGVGTLVLDGTNNYSGTTSITNGTLNIQSASALGGTTNGTSVTSGAALELQGGIAVGAEALTLNGAGATGGALRNVSGNNSYAGAITLGSASTITSNTAATTLTLTGGITDAGFRTTFNGAGDTTISTVGISGTGGDILKQGTGTLNLNVASSYVGSTGGANNAFIDQGTISVGVSGALGTTNGTTTGLISMGAAGTGGLNTTLNIANSGVTLANPIDVRFLQTGGKTISGTFTSSSSTYSGGITLHDNVTLTAANGGTLLFSGVIATAGSGTNATAPTGGFGTGPGVLINSGASSTGIVEYDNAMTYAGDTVVNSGTLQFNGAGSLANSTIRLGNLGAATLNLISPTGSSLPVTINVRPSAGTKTISASNTSGTSTLGGHFALDDNATVLETSSTGTLAITQPRSSSSDTLTGTDIKNHILTFDGSGKINVGTTTTTNGTIYESVAGGSVVKNGNGILTFNDRNTYTGGTTVNGGTLLVNNTAGSGTGTGTVTVNNSGTTLGGTGIITGAVTVNSGANLSPGNSLGKLTTGALTLASGSNFVLDLVNTTPGTGYDQVSVVGATSIGGSNLVINVGGTLNIGDKFYVLLNDSTDANTGTFAQGSTVTSGLYSFSVNYADFANGFGGDGGSNDISLTVTAVPEPGTWLAGALAVGLLGWTAFKRLRPEKLKS